jgi:hypothetical protein
MKMPHAARDWPDRHRRPALPKLDELAPPGAWREVSRRTQRRAQMQLQEREQDKTSQSCPNTVEAGERRHPDLS